MEMKNRNNLSCLLKLLKVWYNFYCECCKLKSLTNSRRHFSQTGRCCPASTADTNATDLHDTQISRNNQARFDAFVFLHADMNTLLVLHVDQKLLWSPERLVKGLWASSWRPFRSTSRCERRRSHAAEPTSSEGNYWRSLFLHFLPPALIFLLLFHGIQLQGKLVWMFDSKTTRNKLRIDWNQRWSLCEWVYTDHSVYMFIKSVSFEQRNFHWAVKKFLHTQRVQTEIRQPSQIK